MANTNAPTWFGFNQRDLPRPVLALAVPILGLVYITILPVIGLTSLVLLSLCRAREGLAATWRRAVRRTVVA